MSLGLTRSSSFDDVAAAIIRETKRRGYSRAESVACVSTGIQESGLRPTAVSPNGKWVGIYQQDTSYLGRDDPNQNIAAFLDRLDVKRRSPGASPDPFKTIFWLQQRPSDPSADTAYDRGRKAYYTEIKQHLARAEQLYDRFGSSAPPAPVESYGLPRGSNSGGYGGNGVKFPDWVYRLGDAFGIKPSTYPGHQESNRNEAGYAPNPQLLNRGIDWAAPGAPDQWERLTRFADYLATIPQYLEQVIWQNPVTMRSIEVAGGRHQPGYFRADLAGHRDHVHTRQSRSIPLPGGASTNPPVASTKPVGWRGDPVWLPDVLREAGLVCHVYPGAFERGHGDMGQLWGVMCHHTGSFGETPKGIAEHPSLGLASQLYLGRNGEYTLCGVGEAWHGGAGSYPGITDVNNTLIGIEAANDGGGTPGKPHRSSWSDVQYDAYVRGVAAILNKLGFGADRCIAHKEWAGKSQGKWDPGAIDMNIFRADVKARLNTSTPGDDDLSAEAERMIREMHRELTQRHPSRSAVREPGEGLVDTWAGMDLNTDGNVDLLATFLRAKLGHPPAIARLQRVAAGTEAGRSSDDALLAQAMLAEVGNKVQASVNSAPQIQASAPNLEIERRLADVLAENARLREENTRLQQEADTRTAMAVYEPDPAITSRDSTGDKIQRAIDSSMDYTEHILAMDSTHRTALMRALKSIDPSNGEQA